MSVPDTAQLAIWTSCGPALNVPPRGSCTADPTGRGLPARDCTRHSTRSDLRGRRRQAHVHGVSGPIGVPLPLDMSRLLPDDESLPPRSLALGSQPLDGNAPIERAIRAALQRASRLRRSSLRGALRLDRDQVGGALPRRDSLRRAEPRHSRLVRRPSRLGMEQFPCYCGPRALSTVPRGGSRPCSFRPGCDGGRPLRGLRSRSRRASSAVVGLSIRAVSRRDVATCLARFPTRSACRRAGVRCRGRRRGGRGRRRSSTSRTRRGRAHARAAPGRGHPPRRAGRRRPRAPRRGDGS